VEAATISLTEKKFLRKTTLHALASGIACATVGAESAPRSDALLGIKEEVLTAARGSLGHEAAVADVQVELKERGHADLAHELSALNRSRRTVAHPPVDLARRVATALDKQVQPAAKASQRPLRQSNSDESAYEGSQLPLHKDPYFYDISSTADPEEQFTDTCIPLSIQTKKIHLVRYQGLQNAVEHYERKLLYSSFAFGSAPTAAGSSIVVNQLTTELIVPLQHKVAV
jgi:hypothetical protein